MTYLEELQHYIRAHGPIATVRVSSAQASCPYPYWGAVRYEVRLRQRDGMPINVALERATSDRRSSRLADADAEEIAKAEGRLELQVIGELSERSVRYVLARVRKTADE